MRIAIPTANGALCAHFGHSSEFTLVEVDPDLQTITSTETVEAPDHEPGLLPRWLKERGVDLVIAGGMGRRAQSIFVEHGVQLLVGAPVASPAELTASYLNGSLETGLNLCDH
jgi:ATP-binding protein involved in chromosome partitioning